MNISLSDFSKGFSKKYFYNLYFPLLVYFILRFSYIFQIPFFEDEAIFTGWSIEMMKNYHNISLPLSYGIAPLFSWLTYFLLFFINNQLLAGRILSILFGAGIVILLHYTLEQIKVRNSLIWIITYIFFPIMFVYNRLAVLDTLLVFFSFGSVIFAFEYFRHHQFFTLINYTIFLFFSILTKQIGLITVPAVLIGGILSFRKIDKFTQKLFIASLFVIASVSIFFLPFYNKSTSFLNAYVINPINLTTALTIIKKNIWLTYNWLMAYYPLLFLLCSAIGVILGVSKGNRFEKYLSYTFLIFFVSIIITDKLYFPRHTLIFAPFLLLMSLLTSKYVFRISKYLSYLIMFLIIINMSMSILRIIHGPSSNTVLALEDKFQFYEDWTSGKLLPEIAYYIDDQSENGYITVLVDSSNMYYGLPLYLKNPSKVNMKWLPDNRNILSLQSEQGKKYIISNRLEINNFNFSSIKEFPVSSRHTVKVKEIQ